jgi:hypothetical protein
MYVCDGAITAIWAMLYAGYRERIDDAAAKKMFMVAL